MTTTSITKIQRDVLEAAARRNDLSAWPIREGKLNIGSTTRVMKELIRKELVVEKPAAAKVPIWREDNDGRSLMAIISDDGLAAIGMLPAGKTAGRPRAATGKKGPAVGKQGVVAGVSQDVPRRPRAGSKLAILVELLGREGGTTIAEMVGATGWQPHSVRGVMSGTLVKTFRLSITSEAVEGRGRMYRLRA